MSIKSSLFASARDMFLKYGVKSVSMDDIARLLGVSKKTIYQSVENKKGLIHAVIKTFVKEEHSAIGKITSTTENAVEEMVSIARHVLKSMKMMNPTLTYDLKKYYPGTWEFVEEHHFSHIEKVIRKNLIRGKVEGLYRDNINENILSKMYVGMAQLIVTEHIFSFKEHELSTLFQNYIEYHLNGILNERGRSIYHSISQINNA